MTLLRRDEKYIGAAESQLWLTLLTLPAASLLRFQASSGSGDVPADVRYRRQLCD
jgi:hypothetical protein